MEPEAEVAAASAVVDDPGDDHDAEAEPYRHFTPRLPIEVRSTDDPRRQIHRHEPQREGDNRDDEGESIKAERHDAGDDGGDLHEDPAAFDPDIEIANRARIAELTPPAELVLDAIDCERCHRHRDRDQKAAGGG